MRSKEKKIERSGILPQSKRTHHIHCGTAVTTTSKRPVATKHVPRIQPKLTRFRRPRVCLNRSRTAVDTSTPYKAKQNSETKQLKTQKLRRRKRQCTLWSNGNKRNKTASVCNEEAKGKKNSLGRFVPSVVAYIRHV